MFLLTYVLQIAFARGQDVTQAEVALANNEQFIMALIIFFVLTISVIIWLVFDRLKSSKQVMKTSENEDFLRKIISDRQDSFYLWNANRELVLKSPFNIKFGEGDTIDSIEDLKGKFLEADQVLFEKNLNDLLNKSEDFTQKLDLNQYNMHLLISGNVVDVDEFGARCFVVWFKDNTISEKIERYQAMESLEKSEKAKLLENALNMADFPIWIRGEDLKLQWINLAYVNAVGGENYDNVLEKNLELTTNTLGVSLKSMAENASLNREAKAENHFIVLDGERKSMDFHNIPYEVNDNKEAIFGYAQDITELQEAKGSLADHTESYGETLDKFSIAVAIFDSDMVLEYYNKAYLRLWGLPESLLFSHPSYGEVLEALRETRKLPEQANFPAWKKKQLEMYKEVIDPIESMMHLPDGKTLRVVMQHHPMGGMLILYEDVTDYFTLESSYNTLIAVQRETLDNLNEGIAVFGFDGRLKLFNDGFINIWEVSNNFLKTDPHALDVMDRCGKLFDSTEEIDRFKNMI
ncbi:MAG: PAS-domain containing protein, partial [Emcibacteraceae bacterium]|nr:PAS-domain containing protein [Emcibacteraceae bacterium]